MLFKSASASQKSPRSFGRGFVAGWGYRRLTNVVLLAVAAISILPLGAYGGTNLRLRATSSVYIDAYVSFIAATTFELFQMMFSIVKLPNIASSKIWQIKNSLAKQAARRWRLRVFRVKLYKLAALKRGLCQTGYKKCPFQALRLLQVKQIRVTLAAPLPVTAKIHPF